MVYQTNAALVSDMVHWFSSRLFHLSSSHLLLTWEGSAGWPKDLGGPLDLGETGSWFQMGLALAIVAIW